jgi:maltodextrin utilization protein YvdJ
MKQSGFKVFIYFIVFSIIFGSLMLVPIYRAYHIKGGLVSIAQHKLPEFEITDYELNCDYMISGKDEPFFYCVDTANEIDESMADGQQFALLADKDSILYKNNDSVMRASYKDILNTYGIGSNLSKATVLKFLCLRSNRLKLLVPFAISFMFMNTFILLITAVWFTLLTYVMNNLIVKTNARFYHLIKLCIYSLTFPSLLRAFMLIFGLRLPSLIYAGLILFYIYTGLKNSKDIDFGIGRKIPDDGIIIAEL